MLDFGMPRSCGALPESHLPDESFDEIDCGLDIGDFPITLFRRNSMSKDSLNLAVPPPRGSRPAKYVRSTSDSLIPREAYDLSDHGHKHSFSSADSHSSVSDECLTPTSDDPSPPFRLSPTSRALNKGHRPNTPSQSLRRRAHLRRTITDLLSGKENVEEDASFIPCLEEESPSSESKVSKCTGPEILPVRPLTLKKAAKKDVRPDSFFWSPLTPTKDGFDSLPLPNLPRFSVDVAPIDWSLIETQLGCMSLDPIAELAHALSPSNDNLVPVPPLKDSIKVSPPPSSAAKRKGIIGAPTKRF